MELVGLTIRMASAVVMIAAQMAVRRIGFSLAELSAAITKSKISSFATSTLIEGGAFLHD